MTDVTCSLRQPFPHQRRAVEQLKLWGGRALLCDEMGLGKSSTALWALDELGADRIVVVCPLSVVHKWAKEVETTLGIPGVVLPAKKYLSEPAPSKAARILHYDLAMRLPDEMLGMLEADGLILDESHYVKNRQAQRSRAVAKLAQRCRYVLCLTGTPVRNDVRDLWHQVQLVRPDHLYSYARFEARYTKSVRFQLPHMRRPVFKYDGTRNEDELAAKLKDVMVMRKIDEVYDLPPKIRVVVPLEMEKEERQRYDEMKRVAMVTLQEELQREPPAQPEWTAGEIIHRQNHVIARTALEQVIRLEQLTCGVLGGSSLDKPVTFVDAAKIQWTLETIDDLRTQGRSVVVFCKFNATIEMLHHALYQKDIQTHPLTGETPSMMRNDLIQQFRDGDLEVLLCQLKLAEGFDLTPSMHCIFLGIDWTPAQMDQAEGRLRRIGMTGTVYCYYPICERSIDKRLFRTVVEKREDAKRVLEPRDVMEELKA